MENSSVEAHLLEYSAEVFLPLHNYSLLCFFYFYYNYLTFSVTSQIYFKNLIRVADINTLCYNNLTELFCSIPLFTTRFPTIILN